jgi:mono/diheme cytochrome c family protein
MWRNAFLIAVLVNLGRIAAADPPDAKDKAPSFAADIAPLLQAKCSKCHGEKIRKADLNLSSAAGIVSGGESGKVIAAGKPDESLLYKKIHAGGMPPKKEPQLTAAEIETIRRWIASGAKMEMADAEQPVNQHDIGQIAMRRCTACHGARRKEAGLDLRTKASMLKGGKSGPAIVLGKPEESLLVKRVRANQMPPPARLVEASVKPMEKTELDVIVRWIAAGAPEINVAPDIATTTPDSFVSDKDRNFWAFRTPKLPPIPTVKSSERVRNPIDAFILQKLEAKGLTLAPEADRATLIRRASFDLTGLPPEAAEVQAFLADQSPDAYERMIDRLLDSPRYGERWARHWLDVAGYADSEGKREQDHPRQWAWRYRDYVIRAFNGDKPYSRFLLEQIAGDELADYETAKEITPEIYDNLVATAFLRMVPDATWANITNYLPDRADVIADEIDVLGSGVMGLTMKCARCHTHKFDPIPHRDYYRLKAIFQGAYDDNDWLKPDLRPGNAPESSDVLPGRLLPYVTSAERREWEALNAKRKPGAKLPEPKIQALWDRGEPTPTYVYNRGDPMLPGRLVGPGVPSVLTDGKTPFDVQPPWTGAKKTGRRLAFAKWLTQSDNPLTARVMMNRIWKLHFGRGIVTSLGNFGKVGSLPSHPELLDWLAVEFVKRGWSIKEMHRLMMTSATYRQSSQARSEEADALFGRMPMTRLDAESLYDTMLLVAGRLDDRRYGPADTVQVRGDGLVTPNGSDRGWRRLIYVQQLRKQLPTHLETFDFAQMNPNCIERRDSTVAPQALYMMNNAMVDDLASRFAERVQREAASGSEQVERIYWIALSRAPSKVEKGIGANALKELSDEWAKMEPNAAHQKALKTYCRAIVNSAGFTYVD